MQILPAQTTANQINLRLRDLYNSSSHYLDEQALSLREISRDIDKLSGVNAGIASCLRARMAGLLGSKEQGEYWLNNARMLGAPPEQIATAAMTLYVNLGYFSMAIEPLLYLVEPANGWSTLVFGAPMINGAFRVINDMYKKAEDMHIAHLQPLKFIPDAAEVMELWGDSDSDYAEALDIAGEVLRKHKILIASDGLRGQIWHPENGDLPLIKLSMGVSADFDTVLDMTMEYLEVLATSGHKIPQSLTFEFAEAQKDEVIEAVAKRSVAQLGLVK